MRCRNDKLENHLAEAIEKLKSLQMHGNDDKSAQKDGKDANSKTASGNGGAAGGSSMTSVAAQHLEDLQKEIEEYRELANNRLQEMDKLHQEHREALKEVEKLKMDVSQFFSLLILSNDFFLDSSITRICYRGDY